MLSSQLQNWHTVLHKDHKPWYINYIERKLTKQIMKDFKITLNRRYSDEIAWMALRATTAAKAINKAHATMGQDWFTVTIEAA